MKNILKSATNSPCPPASRFSSYFGYRNITFFPYRPSLAFQAQVPSTRCVRVCESSILKMEPAEIPFNVIPFLNLNAEISKGRGLLVMVQKLYYAGIAFTMKMNFGNKLYVAIAFKISALLYLGDLKTLIGVELSAWTAASAPSLLSDPPRVFNSSRAPHLKHGPPGYLLGVLGYAARAAAGLFRQPGRHGRSRAKRISGGFCGAPRGGGSVRGGGSFRGGGLRGGNLSRLCDSARAGRLYLRAID
jgi:uncharacterized membrane protein YgcG